jgi:hypothetical protein
MNVLLFVLLGILLLGNLAVSVAILRAATASRVRYFLIVWLMPVVGAFVVWHMLREETTLQFKPDNPHPDDLPNDIV